METSEVMTLMKEAFHDWNDTVLDNLVSKANSSSRHYCSGETLLCQFKELKKRFSCQQNQIILKLKCLIKKEALEEEIMSGFFVYIIKTNIFLFAALSKPPLKLLQKQ